MVMDTRIVIRSLLIGLLVLPIWWTLLMDAGLVNRNTIFWGLLLTFGTGAYLSLSTAPFTKAFWFALGGALVYTLLALTTIGFSDYLITPLPAALGLYLLGLLAYPRNRLVLGLTSVVLSGLLAVFIYDI